MASRSNRCWQPYREHRIGWLVLIPGMVEASGRAACARNARASRAWRVRRDGRSGAAACHRGSDGAVAGAVSQQLRIDRNRAAAGNPRPDPGRRTAAPGFRNVRMHSAKSSSSIAADNEVPPGTPGELAIRGATLFSGYWQADETNARDFRGGWFHMGDVFRRNEDGTLDFVDRAKYMIKTGGENVYPAEIERVLMSDTNVSPRPRWCGRRDAKWGEVPVAFVSCRDASVTEAGSARDCAGAISPATSARGSSASSASRNFPAPPAARSSVTNSKPGSPRICHDPRGDDGREEAGDGVMPPLFRSPSQTVF